MPKLTFSLDEATVATLRAAARRTGKAQSLIIREAIAEHAAREARLSDDERERLMGVLRRISARPAGRSQAEVDREITEIRRSRRTGWSRRAR